jgi:hypothetical protein
MRLLDGGKLVEGVREKHVQTCIPAAVCILWLMLTSLLTLAWAG